MDPFSIIIMLLITFMAWEFSIEWLFWGMLILTLLMSRSLKISLIILGGLAAMYFFDLGDYWFVVFAAMAGLIVLLSQKEGGGGEELPPELFQLLGGE